MKIFRNKEEFRRSLIIFLIIAASLLFACTIYKFDSVWKTVLKIIGFFTPFYVGFGIAYLLNPIMMLFENKVFKKIKKPSTKRGLSILVTYILFLGLIFLFLYFIIPSLISSISALINAVPSNVKSLMGTLQKYVDRHPQINELYTRYSDKIAGYLTQSVEYVAGLISSLLPSVVNVTVSITSGIADFFIGLVISIYMLLSKETLLAQTKKVIHWSFKKETANKILHIGNITHDKMLSYIIGQISISCIDALIVYLVSTILAFPYPVLLAVIVALFNMIPFFGSIIGCVPCMLIILIQNPLKAIYFLIFFIILQQVEGNIYGPKIQGKQLNISALWIIFAILLFGGLFGFIGLLIGVPLFSVIYTFFAEAVNKGLIQKGLSSQTSDYINPKE